MHFFDYLITGTFLKSIKIHIEAKMTQKHIAFIAGTDPIMGYKIIEKELRSRFCGFLAVKKPLNQKQGFLLADF